MKGLVFAEMIRWTEQAFSPDLADEMIRRSGVPNDGAYTSGGYYPHGEAVALLSSLSGLTGAGVGQLARDYGHFLAGRLAALHPEFMTGQPDVTTFLQSVEPHIHSEVRKLYPEARTPQVHASLAEDGTRITYASHRPFADVAHGLIEGFVEWFDENLKVERLATRADGTEAEFLVTRL